MAARDLAHAFGEEEEEEGEEEGEEVCLALSVLEGDWILRLDWYCEWSSWVNCVDEILDVLLDSWDGDRKKEVEEVRCCGLEEELLSVYTYVYMYV